MQNHLFLKEAYFLSLLSADWVRGRGGGVTMRGGQRGRGEGERRMKTEGWQEEIQPRYENLCRERYWDSCWENFVHIIESVPVHAPPARGGGGGEGTLGTLNANGTVGPCASWSMWKSMIVVNLWVRSTALKKYSSAHCKHEAPFFGSWHMELFCGGYLKYEASSMVRKVLNLTALVKHRNNSTPLSPPPPPPPPPTGWHRGKRGWRQWKSNTHRGTGNEWLQNKPQQSSTTAGGCQERHVNANPELGEWDGGGCDRV